MFKRTTDEFYSAHGVEPVFWVGPHKAYRIAPHTSLPMILFQNKRHVEPKKIRPDLAFQSPDNIKPVRPFRNPQNIEVEPAFPKSAWILGQLFHMQEKIKLNVLCRERTEKSRARWSSSFGFKWVCSSSRAQAGNRFRNHGSLYTLRDACAFVTVSS